MAKKEKPKVTEHHELPAGELRWYCDPKQFAFKSTEEVPSRDTVIGQERAVEAIKFGLDIQSVGFNIYVSGIPGTGKNTIIKKFVERISRDEKVPDDWIYIHNFKSPDQPRALSLPPGRAVVLQADLDRLIQTLKNEIRRLFESEEYEKQKGQVLERLQEKKVLILSSVEQEAQQLGFRIKSTPLGVATTPLIGDREVSPEEAEALPDKKKQELQEKQDHLTARIRESIRRVKGLQKEAEDQLEDLNRRVALFAVGHLIDDLKEKYGPFPRVGEFLDEVREDILNSIRDFLHKEGEETTILGMRVPAQPATFERYKVNVLVDNSYTEGAPVILETHPIYKNLIGVIEREFRFGALHTDFTMIKAGSVLKANGGYLILNVLDLLVNPFAWEALKKVIKNREVKIEDLAEHWGFISTTGIRPEPIPVDLKVVLMGGPYLYQLLLALDEDFRKIFKVKADFATEMRRDQAAIQDYAGFISRLCRDESLKHFDPSGVAAVVEHSARMLEHQEKLSLCFSYVADLIRESSHVASTNGNSHVTGSDVERALEQKIFRHNLLEKKIQELIDEGTLLVDVDGAVVGQVNGLSVYDLGDFSFGKPSRITATVGMGKKGVINIEREAEMSGRIHSKGVLILSGYLLQKYAQDKPLTLSASVCFEQSYEGVEGDSASAAELFAILSQLSGVPILQGISVTGSVNQRGSIQPIGGVNAKIEGAYEVCKHKGLNGRQGVLIPRQNVRHLMLKREVVEAVVQGQFHIWPIDTIDDGIEILTGVPAEEIHARVDRKLAELARGLKEFEAASD